MSLFDGNLGPCTSAVTEQLLFTGLHLNAYKEAEGNRERRITFGQSQINLDLPEEIKKCKGWFPVINNGSFNIVKDPNGIISLNSKIPQITSKQAQNLVSLTRNQIVASGIDRYGCKTTKDVAYSDIVDSITKDRIIRICCEANKLGL